MNISKVLRIQYSLSKILQLRALSTQGSPKLSFDEEWKNAKPFDQIPRLSAFTFARRMIPGGKFSGLGLQGIHKELKKEMGDITIFPAMLGRSQIVMAFNPEDFETVFRNEGMYPYRRSFETLAYYRETVRPDIYGKFGSLLNENDDRWYKTRTLVNPIMMKPHIIKLYVPQVDEIAQEFVEVMRKVRDGKFEAPANFADLVNQWSLESVTCIILDRRLGLLKESNNDPNAAKLIKLIREFFVLSYDFEINPSIWKYYQTKGFKKLLQVYDQMTEVILNYIDDAIKHLEKQPPKDEKDQSVLEKLLKIDKKLAVVMCFDALNAGVDTTSSALLTTLYCLAKNPEKQEKLREEVMKILPNKGDLLTVDNMKNLPYLRAVIKEGLRLYSPAAGTLRKVERDVVLAGYQIPKGSEIAMSTLNTSHEEQNFKLAKEFIPERWLRDNVDASCPHAKDAHPFSYMPFGFGARMCVGRRFAELELETMLMRIIRNFKVEWHYPDMKIKGVLLNFPDSDMKFKLIDI